MIGDCCSEEKIQTSKFMENSLKNNPTIKMPQMFRSINQKNRTKVVDASDTRLKTLLL